MIPHDDQNALEEHECPQCKLRHTHKFQWDKGKFWVGKVKNKAIAWAYYMLLQTLIIFIPFVPVQVELVVIVSAVVTFIFMLAGAIDIAVANMKIIAELKYGRSTNVTTAD